MLTGTTGGALVVYGVASLAAAEGSTLTVGGMLGFAAIGATLGATPVLVVGGTGVLVSAAMWTLWRRLHDRAPLTLPPPYPSDKEDQHSCSCRESSASVMLDAA